MLVNLTENQLNKIIELLEKQPEQVEDKYSLLYYLRLVRLSRSPNQYPVLDDIPF